MSMKRKFVTLEETVVLVNLPSNIVVKGGDEMETRLNIMSGMTVSSIKTWCVDWVGKPISHFYFISSRKVRRSILNWTIKTTSLWMI